MLVEPVYQVVVQKIPELVQLQVHGWARFLGWLETNSVGLISGAASIAAAVGALKAAKASSQSAQDSKESLVVSRDSAKASIEAANASKQSAETMQKQYKQQLDQQNPIIKFDEITMEMQSVNIPGSSPRLMPSNISMTIINTRQENLSYVEYVYAIWDGEEVVLIDHKKDNVKYNHLERHSINIPLGAIGSNKLLTMDTMFLYIFTYVEDISWREKYTIFAQQIEPGNPYIFPKVKIVIPPNTDFNSLDTIKENIWKYVMLSLTPDKQLPIAAVLNQDLDFRAYRKGDPRFKNFLPDIWKMADPEDD